VLNVPAAIKQFIGNLGPGPFLRVALMQFKDPQPNPIVVCRTGRAALLDRRVAPSVKEPCDCLAVLAVDGSQFLDHGLSFEESIWAIACMGIRSAALKRKGIFHHSRTGTSSKSVGTNVSDATDTTRNTLLSFFQESPLRTSAPWARLLTYGGDALTEILLEHTVATGCRTFQAESLFISEHPSPEAFNPFADED
jgi:hypothetical protein